MTTDLASGLSAAEINELRVLSEAMIPADTELGMPAADDPLIQSDVVRSIGRDLPLVRKALASVVAKAGGSLAALSREGRETLINEWYAGGGAPTATLGRLILSAYYRDDRVLVAIGHEARSPFPKGYEVEQGDWSLLEAVRHRQPLWRDDRAGER